MVHWNEKQRHIFGYNINSYKHAKTWSSNFIQIVATFDMYEIEIPNKRSIYNASL